jgi:tRNA-5-methyluridine54 2-sulfurtransferase
MNVEQKVKQTLSKIKLNKRDKILVALSGGKDSATTAYLLKKFGYNIEGIHINLSMGSYSNKCLDAVKELCEELGIKLHLYDIKKEMGSSMCYIRSAIQTEARGKGLKNCAICGVIKKWILNKKARELKADKIATGHNLDDEAQTFLINIFKGSPELSANIGVVSKNTEDKKFIPRLKPLFYIPENEVRKFAIKEKLPVVFEKCPCAIDSYRIQVRKFMNDLTDKQKENIVNNAEKILGKIKIKQGSLNYCEICGEPARNKICKKCELMKIK